MPNLIAVVQDDRLRRQIEQFLGELGMDDLRFATFKTNQEFQNLYFRDRSNDPPPPEVPEGEPPPPIEDGAELKLFSEIHSVIFALDTIGEKPGPWLDKLRASMKQYKYWPEAGAPRVLMLKYEDDGVSKLDVLHPLLDDLIYLPLDRLVFLQKMQIFLTLPKKVTPRFLFNQEVQHEIEISKISKVDRLSDVGLAIRNPVPLRKGLPGHFYIALPGEKARLEFRGKVFRSEPHPDYPGQYLVYFSYFGLNKNALTTIRRVLSKAPRYQSLLKDNRDDFRYNPDALWNDPESSNQYGIAIVDPDEIAGANLAQALGKEMDRLEILNESSYQFFLHKYLDGGAKAEEAIKPAEENEFFRNPISLSISATDLKCLSVDPGPTPEDKFLGHQADVLFSSPDGWLSLIQEKQSNLIMQEAALLASKGRVLQKLLAVKDSAGERRAINFKIYRGANEQVVTIEMSPSTLNDIAIRMNNEKNSAKLHFAVMDSNFVPDDPTSWIEGLRMRAVQGGLCENVEQLKFFVTSENETKPNLNWLNAKDMLGHFIKPLDTRQMLFLLSEHLPNQHTMFRFNNVGWSQPQLSVHVAKNLHLEALSEYGATLRSKQKIVPGTMIYLRKSIFENAPNNCLAARVYACGEHPKEKGQFLVQATYFGINDAFLKFARTWIRENYASTKKSE
jgi:hypothetical protein